MASERYQNCVHSRQDDRGCVGRSSSWQLLIIEKASTSRLIAEVSDGCSSQSWFRTMKSSRMVSWVLGSIELNVPMLEDNV